MTPEALTSYESYTWGCGHVGPAACAQCFQKKIDKLTAVDRLIDEVDKITALTGYRDTWADLADAAKALQDA